MVAQNDEVKALIAEICSSLAGRVFNPTTERCSFRQQAEPDYPAILVRIAKKHLGAGNLEAGNSDRLDFVQVHIDSLKTALLEAFEAGKKAR